MREDVLIAECLQVPGHRLFYVNPNNCPPDADGRISLVCVKDTSRGYQALPGEFRIITDPEQLDAIEYFRRRGFKRQG
jgi:hypothetical protein